MFREILQMNFLRLTESDVWALFPSVLWGEAKGLSYTTQQTFRELGISHLFAASGANIAYLASFFEPLSTTKWRRALALLLPICLLLYAVRVNTPSLWRAVGMWSIVWMGGRMGRKVSLLWSLGCVFCLMLFFPAIFGSVSFQLSCAAILGMCFSQAFLSRENTPAGFRGPVFLRKFFDACCVSAVVSLTVACVTWWHFREVNFFGIVGTLLLSNLFAFLFRFALIAQIYEWLPFPFLGGSWFFSSVQLFLAWLLDRALWGLERIYTNILLRWIVISVLLLPFLSRLLKMRFGRKL